MRMSIRSVMLLFLASAYSQSKPDICQQLKTSNCTCREGELSVIFHCKPKSTKHSDFNFSLIFYRNEKRLTLECYGLDRNSSHISVDTQEPYNISGLEIEDVNDLHIDNCPFFNTSLADLIPGIGISKIKYLHIISYTFQGSLKKKHFQHLCHVEKLTLNYNGITSLPSDIFEDMRNLVSLNLGHNYLSHLPQGIFNSTRKLEEVDLKNNSLTQLDSGVFKHLHNLKKLNLSGNRLKNLTKAVFSDVQNLTNLDFDAIRLVTIEPDFFANLTKLKTLNFFINPFVSFSKEFFSKNTELEELNIYGSEENVILNENKTSSNLPSGFLANLLHLKVVRLGGLRLEYLPEDIFNCSINIKKIDLNNNLLKKLPENIFIGLKELEYLDLCQNEIANLPEDLFKDNTKLKTLKLHHNRLSEIPRFDRTIGDLEYLDLGFNELTDITFLNCPSLMVLNISNNRLTTMYFDYNTTGLLSVLFPCPILKEIQLAHNSLTEMVYDDWRTSRSLHTLNLSFNSMQSVSMNSLLHYSDVTVDLSNNNISLVTLWNSSVGLFKDPKKQSVRTRPVNVHLDNNPLKCDCHIQPFVQFLQGHPPSDPITEKLDETITDQNILILQKDNLKCRESETLPKKNLTSVDQNLLICELNSSQPFDEVPYACPDNCSCHYRAVDRANVFNCTNTPLSLPLVNKANHSELILRRSQLTKFHLPEGNGYENLTRLDLSHNNLTEFTIAGTSTIKNLDLSYNNLSSLDTKTIKRLESSPLTRLVLHNNSWLCDCDNVLLLRFIQSRCHQLKGQYNVTCSINDVLVPIKDVYESDICFQTEPWVIMVICILLFVSIVPAILRYCFPTYAKVLYYSLNSSRYMRWLVPHQDYDASKEYDAFISYANEDEGFVTGQLVPLLENYREGVRLCLHYRDWLVGDFIQEGIVRSINNSRRTVVVLSPNYLRSEWAMAEFRFAHSEFMRGRTKVIVILYDDVDMCQIPDADLKIYLQMVTYLKWGSKWFWNLLLHALPRPPIAEREETNVEYRNGQVHMVDNHEND